MNIHEYQAKELLARFGVPVPAGHDAHVQGGERVEVVLFAPPEHTH